MPSFSSNYTKTYLVDKGSRQVKTSLQNWDFLKKASFVYYQWYISYLTNCASLDIVVITHWEMKWKNLCRICRKKLVHPLKILFIMAQRRSKMSKKEFDDQFEAFLKEVGFYPCSPGFSNSLTEFIIVGQFTLVKIELLYSSSEFNLRGYLAD